MSYRFIIIVPGSIQNEDGRYSCANSVEEKEKCVKEWRDMGFCEIVVYEKTETR